MKNGNRSYKTAVIESIFSARWEAGSQSLSSVVVSLDDVSQAITEYNEKNGTKFSTNNPGNFIKDVIRNNKSANSIWPKLVFDEGYSCVQKTGDKRCFEFIEVAENQLVPFPLDVEIDREKPPHVLESVSLPLASRKLGRRDESWLTQVAVRLRLIESYFALYRPNWVVSVDHLQTNMKLGGKAEVDSVYLATVQEDDELFTEIVVSVEAKGFSDDIVISQIVKQVKSLFLTANIEQDRVLPVALKIVGESEVGVVEFHAVNREDAKSLETVLKVKDAVFKFVPAVEGIR